MTDNLSPDKRSKIMRAVKSRDTWPEVTIRRALHAAGYRFRLHSAALPGKPDIIFPSRKKAVFVHGCFWHVHSGCAASHIPGSAFWKEKLRKNVERDMKVEQALWEAGWQVFVAWECELKADPQSLYLRLKNFLGPVAKQASAAAPPTDLDTS